MSQQPVWSGTAPQYSAPQSAEVDPLEGGDKAPAVSFKDAPVGTTVTMTITAPGRLIQSRNFDTGEPDFWPGNVPGQQGNPKMAAVYNGEVNGEPRSIWATKPSALFAALVEAQKKAGQKIAPGGTLHVRFTGEVPNTKNPRLNAIKQYAAMYQPPVAADPLAGAPDFAQPVPQAQPQQQVQQPAQQAFQPAAAPAAQPAAPAPQQAAPVAQAADPFQQAAAPQAAPAAGDPFAAGNAYSGNPPY